MPSPFPGMDPYLESPKHWRGFHELFISAMTAVLNATLPEGFVANIDERLYVLYEQRSIYPDVALLSAPAPLRLPSLSKSSVGVLERELLNEDEALEVTLLSDEQRESYIEILQLGSASTEERLVAMVEVLSPGNKAAGIGREEYRRKQRTVLQSAVHLLEIDLLRAGEHTVAVPEESVGSAPYLVCLHPGGVGGFYRCWPRMLRKRLPRVRIPLGPPEVSVTLDLQSAFDRAYEAGPYRSRIDYRAAPDPPFDASDTDWADALLREAGRRS